MTSNLAVDVSEQKQTSNNQSIPHITFSTPDIPGPAAELTNEHQSITDISSSASSISSRYSCPSIPPLSRENSTNYVRDPFSVPPPYQSDIKPRPPLRGRSSTWASYASTQINEPLLKSENPDTPEGIEKPWLSKREPLAKTGRALTISIIIFGALLSVLHCYLGYKKINFIGNVCLIMDEDFSNGLDHSRWQANISMGGFGNGEFEMTTTSSDNIYIEDSILYLVPTLTSDEIGNSSIFNGYTYNVTGCTSNNVTECGAVSNSTLQTVINPVKSARISTVNSTSLKYGRVEVVARIPEGDWLWPAIWMLPKNNVYGAWPMSGEIDIMESRGNNASYPMQGRDYVRSSLNWGPTTFINSVGKTYGWHRQRRGTFADEFHTYTLEWTDKFIRAYVDNRNKMMFEINLNEPFFKRGDYPATAMNGSTEIMITNPWQYAGNNAAPFDQEFYLILNVAVGGTNGWFPDGYGDKPWLNTETNAMYDFAKAQDAWYSTWPSDKNKRGMAVSSVKMWQKC